MLLIVDVAAQPNGEYLAQVPQVPGAHAYGVSANEALTRAQANALRLLAEQVELGAQLPQLSAINFQTNLVDSVAAHRKLSRAQIVKLFTFGLGAAGLLTVALSQWWISTAIANEGGPAFSEMFRDQPFRFVGLWSAVIMGTMAAGALAGLITSFVRDALHRSELRSE